MVEREIQYVDEARGLFENGYYKRELDVLRAAGRIEFVGPSKTGTY